MNQQLQKLVLFVAILGVVGWYAYTGRPTEAVIAFILGLLKSPVFSSLVENPAPTPLKSADPAAPGPDAN